MEQLSNRDVIRAVLERHDFRFSKSLGQNFLVNPTVCPRIAEEGLRPGCGALEIGPGIGVLTHELAKRARKVAAVELDGRLLPVLAETLAEHQNVTIVQGDAMKLDLHALLREQFGGMEVCVCANLPYYITSPLLMRLLEERLPLSTITVMVQKEAAQRLCALPGTRDCGAVSFAVRYYSEPQVLFEVSRGSFLPPPKVDSAVIRLTVRPRTDGWVLDEAFLFRAVKAGFSQRRKTLPNPLSGALGVPKAAVADALAAAGLSPAARAEELTVDGWITLANRLYEERRHG